MEFPFGHSHHHHQHREEEEEERRKRTHTHYPQRDSNPPPFPYPPPGSQYPEPPQPFAHVQQHAHQGPAHVIYHEAYPPYNTSEFGPPPPNPYPRPGYEPPGGSFPRPGYEPSGSSIPRPGRRQPDLPRGQVMRVFCKADPDFSLSVRNGSVVLVHANANDELQQWIKDETYSTKVKDERSYPSFSLVNKATGQALKHGLGESQPVMNLELFCSKSPNDPCIHVVRIRGSEMVLLTEYRSDALDESILWTTSEDMGHGYRTLRQVNDIRLNVDAFHGDKKTGGVKDGNPIVLWGWKKGDNQLWKIVPY